MAIVKHIKSRNANYSDALNYLIFQHDESTGKMILDEFNRPLRRDELYVDALAGMMSKHVVSLYDMCYSSLLQFDLEQWDEKITDCINYLILLKALIKEEQAYGSH